MIKRGIDLLGAVVGLGVLVGPGVVIAALIWLDSRGPVFYWAKRVGRDGRPFRMLKFRTMVVDAERLGPGLTRDRDPRVTRVGRWLRRTRLDELPQLVNVVRGEMSLVGPRPEAPQYVDVDDPRWRRVLQVRPGVAGLTQLQYADEAALLTGVDVEGEYVARVLPRKLAIDLEYVERQSAALDVWILAQTARAVLAPRRRRAVAVEVGAKG